MAETEREEFPQGLKARFCVSLNVGAPFVPQGKKAPTLRCIYEMTSRRDARSSHDANEAGTTSSGNV